MPTIAIIVNLQIEGLHSWPECDIEQVDYLKYPHRHIFYITAERKVYQENREIEIIQFKKEIEKHLREKFYSPDKEIHHFGNLSCESIAKLLVDEFKLISCQVLEDGENGAKYYA